ncbi:uncharacterized protein PGTG_08142 [Puccinia graminis f. sp. tritici CRL 75-36-700-3]|uniref:Uncharacterized protein n=1 Tax=Puccinia graminis f. sp. tritici (strain CRL 75-36-700-3 / race SCCL) TaxID=418459 RepID=E3KCE5_PUCGT|nr:uncharacterized protein PGTG_08142 [Puccinia graminis f. sp. tritici CRL 75-36-700-3]EFP81893.2 hypothetical protein PGTG_08142 [Puccinia graminis f. sp. tritici CRL 75-36-700-3]
MSPQPDPSSPIEQPDLTPAVTNSELVAQPVDAVDTNATPAVEAQIIEPTQSDLHPDAALLDDHSGNKEETGSKESAGPLDENTREVVSDPVSGNHETPVLNTIQKQLSRPRKYDEVEIPCNEVQDSIDAADSVAIASSPPGKHHPDYGQMLKPLDRTTPQPGTQAMSALPVEHFDKDTSVSSPQLNEPVDVDEVLPVASEMHDDHTIEGAAEDAIEQAALSNESTTKILDQVSSRVENEPRSLHPIAANDNLSGSLHIAPQDVPILKDNVSAMNPEDVAQEDPLRNDHGNELATTMPL